MEKFIAKAYVEKVSGEDGVLEAAIASDGIVDREGDVISPDAWDLKAFKKNPQFLWGHNIREYKPPIGRIEKFWFEGTGKNKRLMFKPKFDLQDSFAAEIYRKYKEKFLNAFSVGFIPLDADGNTYTKAELLEISAVCVPANPRALVAIRGSGLKSVNWSELNEGINEEKAVVSFKSTDVLPDSASWNASEAFKRVQEWAKKDGVINYDKFKDAFTWFNDSKADEVSSYKLLHHDVRGDKLVVNFRGVAAAMALLIGANGGIDISDDERRGVYEHLKKHYKQFDKPVPDFRLVEEQVLKTLHDEVKYSTEQEFMGYVKYTLRGIRKELRKERK